MAAERRAASLPCCCIALVALENDPLINVQSVRRQPTARNFLRIFGKSCCIKIKNPYKYIQELHDLDVFFSMSEIHVVAGGEKLLLDEQRFLRGEESLEGDHGIKGHRSLGYPNWAMRAERGR